MIGPEVYQLTAEVTTYVTNKPRRYSSADGEPIQHDDDILTTKTLAQLYSQTLARTHLDYGEGARSPTIHQRDSDNVPRLGCIQSGQRGPVHSGHHRCPPPGNPVVKH